MTGTAFSLYLHTDRYAISGSVTDRIDITKIHTLEEALAIIAVLVATGQQREEQIALLTKQIALLTEQVARLSKNSSTSSKPPSSDIVKPPSERRQPGKRKIGGQPGHTGKNRILLPPDQVDVTVPHQVESCPDCGSSLTVDAGAEEIVQQVIELRDKPIEVTEHRLLGCRCDKCNVVHYPSESINAGQLLGPRLQALTSYMKGNLGASYTDLSAFFKDVLGLPVSRGMLCRVVQRTSEALRVPYEEVEEKIPSEAALNIDETSWKDNGKMFWLWIFCTQSIAFFSIHRSRGAKVLKEVLGETFEGAITSDFYSAYVSYSKGIQQFCLAHLIRDIKFLTTLPDVATKRFGTKLLVYFRRLFRIWNARDRMPPEELNKKCKRLQRKLFKFLHSEEVPPGGTKMRKRLVRHWSSLFRFVEHPELYKPTNNHAEQNLRLAVRIRRQTQGSRSPWGREWAARIITVIQTCRLQNRSPWAFILDAVNAKNLRSQPPSLLLSTS